MIAFFPDGSIQWQESIYFWERCLTGIIQCSEKIAKNRPKLQFQKILKQTQMKKNRINLKKINCHMTQSITWFKKTRLSHCIHSVTVQNYFMFVKFWNVALQKTKCWTIQATASRNDRNIKSAIIRRSLRKFEVKCSINWWKMWFLFYQGTCFIHALVYLMIW